MATKKAINAAPAVSRKRASRTTKGKPKDSKQDYNGSNCIEAGQLEPIIGTAADDALKQLEAWHENDEAATDEICEHFTMMTHSPSFKAFLVRAKSPEEKLSDPDWNLAWFGAEMLTAGILMGLRQFGRRPAVKADPSRCD